MVVKPFSYADNVVPEGYVCKVCGASGCKLWRQYNTFADHIELHCAVCAAAKDNEDLSTMDDKGFHASSLLRGMRTDQLCGLMPAVPTEDGESYWGYTTVPQPGCNWWARLPSLPKPASP